MYVQVVWTQETTPKDAPTHDASDASRARAASRNLTTRSLPRSQSPTKLISGHTSHELPASRVTICWYLLQ